MITLFDLSAEFWRNALGGKDPMNGYQLTLERVEWYAREGRCVVCCDSPVSHRKAIHEAYKSNRAVKPPDAVDALRSVEQRIRDWGTPCAGVEGWEADDIIATLSQQGWPEPVRIIGSEKDFFCLMSDRVQLIGRRGPLSSNDCFRKFGVAPSQMTDWLTLAGDAADGVPGCANCGPGRAADLLQRFCDAEGVRSAPKEELLEVRGVGKKTVEGLAAFFGGEPSMYSITRQLVELRKDLPIELDDLLP